MPYDYSVWRLNSRYGLSICFYYLPKFRENDEKKPVKFRLHPTQPRALVLFRRRTLYWGIGIYTYTLCSVPRSSSCVWRIFRLSGGKDYEWKRQRWRRQPSAGAPGTIAFRVRRPAGMMNPCELVPRSRLLVPCVCVYIYKRRFPLVWIDECLVYRVPIENWLNTDRLFHRLRLKFYLKKDDPLVFFYFLLF